jgi:hypothetical protein
LTPALDARTIYFGLDLRLNPRSAICSCNLAALVADGQPPKRCLK